MPDQLFHLLLALAAILVTSQMLGVLFRCFGQPPVMGEVVGGLLLGPSFLGWLAPQVRAYLLPPVVTPSLGAIAQVGIILYLFLVGLELNPGVLRLHARAAVAISGVSIVVPFLMGAGLALILYPQLSSADVAFMSFALFLGVALSITAFPVLARILTDREMNKTPLGVLALTCAATGDVMAWCLLAFVVGVARAKLGGAIFTLLLTLAYIAFMMLVVRPLADRILSRYEDTATVPRGVFAGVFLGLVVSALGTELIGVHALFGAFLFGAILTHDGGVARSFTLKLEELVTVLLLPVYFAFTGLRTEVGLIAGVGHWLLCGLILVAATAGKFGGTFATARLSGLGWRDSTALGLLMNTRGLMELVVLNVGLELGVISPTLFAMLVVMAIVTTLATTPLLQLLSWIARPALFRSVEVA
jgi:Kef-type K+ transport system membrane component KefB